MASGLSIERNESEWESEIVTTASPAKKPKCEGAPPPPPPPQCSPEEKDPRSEIVCYSYDSEDVEDDSDGLHEFTDKEFQEYARQITESDGFDVMHFHRTFACGMTVPVYHLNRIADDLKTFSELALKEYNDKENRNLEFVKVVKANCAVCAGFRYYITFDVKDADADAVDGRIIEFQACVWDGIGKTEVLISRPKIAPNQGVIEGFTKHTES